MQQIPLSNFVLGFVVICVMAIPAGRIAPTPVIISLGLFALGLFSPLVIGRWMANDETDRTDRD
jgi:hypothetical protein